ncbi:MAG: hemerythrin domain-containing protein [Gordonia sp. (in: high G+C Gram-positive bacteria)]
MPTSAPTTPTPDLLGMKVAHRAMLADSARFARILGDVAGGASCSTRRAEAIADYLADLASSIEHHHNLEDFRVFPLLEDKAENDPAALADLEKLSDDHDQLDPLLVKMTDGAAALVAAQAAERRIPAAELRCTLVDLNATLTEHLADEERIAFPLIERFITCAEWKDVEAAAQKGGKLGFEFPRFFTHTTDAERERMFTEAGIGMRIMAKAVLATAGRSFERRERAIAGE